MAVVDLKSGATPSSPFASWAAAASTLAAANAVLVSGDTLNVSKLHAEATAGISLTIPGSASSVTRIFGGTEDGSSGLTDLATGAVIASNNTSFAVNGAFIAHSITWQTTSSSSLVMSFGSSTGSQQVHKNCRFELAGAGASSSIKFGAGTSGMSCSTVLHNPVFKFGNTGQRVGVDGNYYSYGGSIDGSGSAITAIFNVGASNRSHKMLVDSFDASAAATAVDIMNTDGQSGGMATFRRMKLPTSWSGRLVNPSNVKIGNRFELIDYSVGTTLYKTWIEDYAGQVRDESTIKVTANTRSYKMASNANCSIVSPMRSHEYFVPLSGSAQTLTLDVITDGVTLTDAEAFLEVDYFAASASSLGTILTDAAATELTTPANQATSTTTWTTTGLGSPTKQALSVTLTAGRASYAIVRAVLRKASTTVYLDDNVVVS